MVSQLRMLEEIAEQCEGWTSGRRESAVSGLRFLESQWMWCSYSQLNLE